MNDEKEPVPLTCGLAKWWLAGMLTHNLHKTLPPLLVFVPLELEGK